MKNNIIRIVLFTHLTIQFAVLSVTRADDRPNIVFAFADDWGRFASAYREGENDSTPNSVVSTPNFDRVARRGVLFNNAFVTAPSCTPCRSSLLSGQYFFRTGRGAILQGAIWDLSIPTYPLLLKDAGYHIGHSYKVWSPGTPRNAPYGAEATAYNKAGNKFNGFSQFVSNAADKDTARDELYEEVRANFHHFLDDRRRDEPFCYWFGPTNCHRRWIQGSGKEIWGLNPDDLQGKLPPFLPDNEVVRQDVCDYLGEVQAFDAGLGVLLAKLEEIGELNNTLVVVSGDHGIPGFPNGKCNLYDFGVHVSLAACWGDHIVGERTVDDFVNLMDLAPTFLDAAGLEPPEVMTGRSFVEILKSKKHGQVVSTRDHVIVGRERHVADARIDNLPYPQRAIRTKDFLYIRNFKPERWPMGVAPGFGLPNGPMPSNKQLDKSTFVAFGDMDASPTKTWIISHREEPGIKKCFDIAFDRRPAEELYDLSKDSHQMQNVAAKSAYSETRKDLAGRLLATLKQTGDPRVIGDGSIFDKSPFSDSNPRKVRK